MDANIAVGDEEFAFPNRLTVLSVDDSMTCLKILEFKLLHCNCHVISTTSAIKALNILRGKRFKIDIVITDVHMPDMDGFQLLEYVSLEMDLPCIMVSADDAPKTVMKGIEHGACDYLLKPVRIEELRTIWKHIIRKEKAVKALRNVFDRKRKGHDEDEDEDEEDKYEYHSDGIMPEKKKRMVWTQELHHKFMGAIKILGVHEAFPAKILEIMNVDGLTRAHVASHLQKYRGCLEKLEWKANIIASRGPQSHLSLLQFSQQNSTQNISNTNTHHGLTQAACPITDLGSRFHHGIAFNQQAPSTLSTRLPQFQGNNSVSFSPNPVHSFSAANTFPMTSGLSPRVTQFDYSPSNFPLSLGTESLNINTNMNNLTVDSIHNLSGTNQGHSTTQNDVFASSGNSHNQMMGNAMGLSGVAMNVTDQSNYNSNVILGQQSRDIFMENSYMQGDVGSSGYMFAELDDLINLEEVAGNSSWLPDIDLEPNH